MKFKLMLGMGVSALLLSITSVAKERQIPCPSPLDAKEVGQVLDTVGRFGVEIQNKWNFYIWSHIAEAEINGEFWQVVTRTNASDFTAAFNEAQNIIKNIAIADSEYAEKTGYAYVCRYSNADRNPVAFLLTFKDQQDDKQIPQLIKKLYSK